MPLNLKPALKTELQKALASGLELIKVDKDTFLDRTSTIGLLIPNAKLPQSGNLHNKLNTYIGEWPLGDFLGETLGRELYEENTYNSENTGTPLNNFQKYQNLELTAIRLITEFDTLPWDYLVTIEFPLGIGKYLKDSQISYELCPFLKITVPNANYETLYPLESDIERRNDRFWKQSLLGRLPKTWNQETANIQFTLEGFVGFYKITNPIEEVIETLKSFWGLSLAVQLMKIEKNSLANSLMIGSIKSNLVIHKKIDAEWKFWSAFDLPRDLSETLFNLKIDDQNGKIESDVLKRWVLDRLNLVSIAFKNLDKSEQVLRAARWYFDSYIGTNELLSFLQAMVAMEILLGKESKQIDIGIGELLRNRCAYLIGKSFSDRKEILKDFNSIYDVRSRIVHRGKSRLNIEERALFTKLQWMCRRVITEELNLIAKDQKETK